jgi:hypothetical protein
VDYEVQRCSRHCAATGRELVEGETFYSVLLAKGPELERVDYSVEAWPGAPAEALGWWKSRMPTREERKAQMAPSDVLLEIFTGLVDEADKQDMRYVLALLLVRRRILRLEEAQTDATGGETLILYCPRDESKHSVAAVLPDTAREAEIQAELSRLLFAQAS